MFWTERTMQHIGLFSADALDQRHTSDSSASQPSETVCWLILLCICLKLNTVGRGCRFVHWGLFVWACVARAWFVAIGNCLGWFDCVVSSGRRAVLLC